MHHCVLVISLGDELYCCPGAACVPIRFKLGRCFVDSELLETFSKLAQSLCGLKGGSGKLNKRWNKVVFLFSCLDYFCLLVDSSFFWRPFALVSFLYLLQCGIFTNIRRFVKDNTAKLCDIIDIKQGIEIKNNEITYFVAHIHMHQQGI